MSYRIQWQKYEYGTITAIVGLTVFKSGQHSWGDPLGLSRLQIVLHLGGGALWFVLLPRKATA